MEIACLSLSVILIACSFVTQCKLAHLHQGEKNIQLFAFQRAGTRRVIVTGKAEE
jgi:hypothetical protein